MMDGECLECGEVGNWCKCDGEIADNTDALIEAMKHGFAARLADVEARAEAVKNDFATRLADAEDALETHKARIAELRQALIRLACYAAIAESENTREWMDGLVGHLNSAAVTVNEPKQFVLHRDNRDDSMWITVRDIP